MSKHDLASYRGAAPLTDMGLRQLRETLFVGVESARWPCDDSMRGSVIALLARLDEKEARLKLAEAVCKAVKRNRREVPCGVAVPFRKWDKAANNTLGDPGPQAGAVQTGEDNG